MVPTVLATSEIRVPTGIRSWTLAVQFIPNENSQVCNFPDDNTIYASDDV